MWLICSRFTQQFWPQAEVQVFWSWFSLISFQKAHSRVDIVWETWRSKELNVSATFVEIWKRFSFKLARKMSDLIIARACSLSAICNAIWSAMDAVCRCVLFLVLAMPKLSDERRSFFTFQKEIYVWENHNKPYRGFYLLHRVTKEMLGLATGADTPTTLEVISCRCSFHLHWCSVQILCSGRLP